MRIVHVITRLIVGGAQENTLLSCEGQHGRGHDVTLITGPAVGPEGSLMDRATSYGYRVEVVPMGRAIRPIADWRAYKQLVRGLVELRPDVVHTHSSKAGIIGRWAAHEAGRIIAKQGGVRPAVVHTIHGLAFTASTKRSVNKVYEWLERRAAPISDAIVCVATAMAEQSLAARIGRPEQYMTVYSGMETRAFVDPPVTRAEVRRSLGMADDDLVAGTIARLFYLKGHDDLLAMAPRLCAQFPRLKFMFVGDGLLRPQFEQRIADMHLTDRFILTGLVPPSQIPQLVNAMDILVHPSRREGLARAIPQGGLAAIPVVTYDVDGNREGLLEGQSGWAVKAFDIFELERRLAELAGDPEKRRRMGEAGRRFALGRFDTRVMVEALEKVYADAVASVGGGSGPVSR
ncbi:MAG TPA: glycosyltransferase family 4 protein [Tepidisphaeraceae bacterium]|nr:glycosyltransferase family 4 protein [Tepidisphaeraceae bacterium]